jgi:hypothetical protein
MKSTIKYSSIVSNQTKNTNLESYYKMRRNEENAVDLVSKSMNQKLNHIIRYQKNCKTDQNLKTMYDVEKSDDFDLDNSIPPPLIADSDSDSDSDSDDSLKEEYKSFNQQVSSNKITQIKVSKYDINSFVPQVLTEPVKRAELKGFVHFK